MQRRKQNQRDRGGATRSNQVLDHLARSAQLRVVDVQQRQARRRPDRGARPCHVEQRGRHAQIGAGLLQLPGELPEPHRRPSPGHGSTATVDAPLRRTTSAVSSRSPTTGTPATSLTLGVAGQTGGDHFKPVIVVPPELVDQVGDRSWWPTATTVDMHWPTERSRCSRLRKAYLTIRSSRTVIGMADQQVDAGQLVVEGVGEQGQPGGEAPARVQHLAELVGAGPDEPHVVPAQDQEQQDPCNRKKQADQHVLKGWMYAEAEQHGRSRGNRRGGEVSARRPPQVNPGPGGRPTGEPVGLVIIRERNRIGHTHPPRSSHYGGTPPPGTAVTSGTALCCRKSDAQPSRLVYPNTIQCR